MLQLYNHTPFQCSLGVFADLNGVECAYCVAKATFALVKSRIVLAAAQALLVLVDETWGEPGVSSLKTASEMTLSKPATDLLMMGYAYALGGRAREATVRLRVGSNVKIVQVFGNRAWKSRMLGWKITDPEPFDRIPLVYEQSFGGIDLQPVDPSAVDYEARNPLGRGLVPRNSKMDTEGTLLPNLEDPNALIHTPKDRPAPAGFGPISPQWEPRRSYAGTYDENWTKTRAPFLPADFDPRFLQVSHPDLISKGYLKGGEKVEIEGASPNGLLSFELPFLTLDMVFQLGGEEYHHCPNLDTIVFDPESSEVRMVWRACQVVDKSLTRLSEVEVVCKEYPQRRKP